MQAWEWKGFDAYEAVEAASDALPAGEYRVITKGQREIATKAGTGTIVFLAFEVIDGPCKGRTCDLGFNLRNPNPVAERIAKSEVGKILLAIGVPKPKHNADILGKTLFLTVKTDDYNGRKNNRFVSARPSVSVVAVPNAPSNGATSAAPATKKLPWQQ